ncbi:hypothetical protein tloyanaT_07480 [Thalassotalea loyana]|uniref:Uncharacterized protein n=1 Tax=Thalassotalea loyana TaxID=280483 RepID=A0ABQ6HC93_9GAMM|nr:hypothetical protein [Thalassotalea loyana]GLX84496.1 hypothetical protein tloyanaT_07480 [Thalassotalea loyana]
MKINKFWTALGLVLFITGVIDLLFYWPTNGEVGIFLVKKSLYVVIGALVIWDNLIKPLRMSKTNKILKAD